MLLFERLRTDQDGTHYETQRTREETLISIEGRLEILYSDEGVACFDSVLTWCNEHSVGLVTLPIYLGSAWSIPEYMETVKADCYSEGDFYISCTNLTDATVIKLMLGKYFRSQGVWVADPTEPMFKAHFHEIHDVKEILLYRPNAVLDI